jgi:predicted aspartyl protease
MNENELGFVYTEVTLENSSDAASAKEGRIKDSEVRRATVRALVDTGASTLVIGEDLAKELGLVEWFPGTPKLAGEGTINGYYTYPIGVKWKNRGAGCTPFVVKQQSTPLLGALALEGLDLIVDPLKETVVGRHGDEQVSYIM